MSAYTDTFQNPSEIPMGCFLTCFGFENSRKRRKPAGKTITVSAQQSHGRYVPLDSEIHVGPEIKENCISGHDDEPQEKQIGRFALKIKKKVRFNLEVKAYEPIPDYHSDVEEDQTTWENSVGPSIWSKSSSIDRYQNCRDNYEDEDEEFQFDENDLNFDDSDDEYDENPNEENLNPAREITTDQISDEDDRSPELHRPDIRARDRGKYVFNVLNPVENLTQWKAIKSKAAGTPQLKRRKENENAGCEDGLDFKKMGSPGGVSRPAECTAAVNVSLSNWVGSVGTQTSTIDAKIQSRNS